MSVTLDVDVLSAKRQGIFIGSDRHQLLIGWIGLLLPFLLVVAVTIRPTANEPTLLPSLSVYYYSSGVAVLEGTLAALALFLLAYQGYPGKYQWADKAAASKPLRACVVDCQRRQDTRLGFGRDVRHVCGLFVVAVPLDGSEEGGCAAALVAYKLKTETTGNPDVLLPECVVISAFAASWLVKGGAIARWLPD